MADKHVVSADDVIRYISEALSNADGKFIEKIANQVISENVQYIGDSFFQLTFKE